MTENEKREAELEEQLAFSIHYGRETDRKLIEDLALNGKDEQNRRLAIEKLQDQHVLLRVIEGEEHLGEVTLVSLWASRYLTDPDIIAEALKNGKPYCRMAVAAHLTDEEKYFIAMNDPDTRVAAHAASCIKSAEMRRKLIDEAEEPAVRIGALHLIFDREYLMELYKREPSGEVRAEIASRVTDPDTLVRYACEEDSEPAIVAAVRHLTDILSKAAWEANRGSKAEGKAAWDRQGRALCTIANRLIAQGLAADVAADAIRHISNLDILREINLKGATEAVQNAYDTKYRYLNGECHMMQIRRDRPSASFPAGYPYKDEFEYIDSQYD